MREKLVEIISDAEVKLRFKLAFGRSLSPVENATILADHLIERGVTILPEGAIILTRQEIDALNEYQKKHLKVAKMENLNAEQVRYKMSEKQIKTALECLSKPNSSPADREKCYFMWKEPSCFSCYHEVAQNALALINSQEQRIKELTEVVERSETAGGCKESVDNGFSPSVTELQRENERLKLADSIASVSVPEALRIINEYCESYIKRAEAKTVRKMQEMLCEGRVSNDPVVIATNVVVEELLEKGE